MRSEFFSGQTAREWKQQIAALATKTPKSVRTLKFPLEGAEQDLDFDASVNAYNIAEGIDAGTLIAYLCAAHLSSFRLFQSAGEAAQFRNRDRLPEQAFQAAMKRLTGTEQPKITVQSLLRVLSKRRRQYQGRTRDWSVDALAALFHHDWTGEPTPRDLNSPTWQFALRIARPIIKTKTGWAGLADQPEHALTAIGKALKTHRAKFPSFTPLAPATPHRPPTSTLCLDPDAPFVPMGSNNILWLHQCLAILAARLRETDPDLTITHRKFGEALGLALTTTESAGISWLFGKGLTYFRETSLSQITKDFDATTKDRPRVRQLIQFAQAIPADPLFAGTHHRHYANRVGARLRGWVSNYCNRLQELHTTYQTLPSFKMRPSLGRPQLSYLFNQLGFSASDLTSLTKSLPIQIKRALRCIEILTGDGIPDESHIEQLHATGEALRLFHEYARHLDRRIAAELDATPSHPQDDASQRELAAIRETLNLEFIKPKRLNRYRGGHIHVESDIAALQVQFNDALHARRQHFKRLHDWALKHNRKNGLPTTVLAALRASQMTALLERDADPDLAREFAVRQLMQPLAPKLKRLSPPTAKSIRRQLIDALGTRKDANALFTAPNGAIYPQRFGDKRSRPQLLPINTDRAFRHDWLRMIKAEIANIERKLSSQPSTSPELLRDLLNLEHYILQTQLHIVTEPVPSTIARPDDLDQLPVQIPSSIKQALTHDTVSAGVALRTFNLLNTLVNSMWYRISRPGFLVTTSFRRTGDYTLLYVPTDRPWFPPQRYLESDSDIHHGLKLHAVVSSANNAISPIETAKQLSDAQYPEPGARSLLAQSPHQWHVELNLGQKATATNEGIRVSKTRDNLSTWHQTHHPTYRLVGPPRYKNQIDQVLTSPFSRFGEYTLVHNREFHQQLHFNKGRVEINARPGRHTVEIALPIETKPTAIEPIPDLLYNQFASIRLVQYRIYYAAFSIPDYLNSGILVPITDELGNPCAGYVNVPQLRHLSGPSPRLPNPKRISERFVSENNRRFDTIRKFAMYTGCRYINEILARHRAFPVLPPLNRNRPSEQIDLIHQTILQHYLYSSVDMHNDARKSYWFGAYRWNHPYLHLYDWNREEHAYTDKSAPARLSPGIVSLPAGATRTCHSCGRNPIASIESGASALQYIAGKPLEIHNGPITLKPPLDTGTYSAKRMAQTVLNQMRRTARGSEQSTINITFRCVYDDCDFSGDGHLNATINTGRTFLERIDTNKTQRSL